MVFRRLLLLIGLAACVSGVRAVDRAFLPHGAWHVDLESARAESRVSGRPMMLVFTRTGDCPACEPFRSAIVGTTAFLSWAERHVVLVDVDDPGVAEFPEALRLQNAKLARDYAQHGVGAVPCALFLKSDGQVIGRQAFYGDLSDADRYLAGVKQFLEAERGGRGTGQAVHLSRSTLTQLIGWIPAVILPTATLLQLLRLIRARSSEGVSTATWALFALANVSLYIFTEKYTSPQAIIGMLFTALLNVIIVVLALAKRPKTA